MDSSYRSVHLNIYDLTQGMARSLSPMLLGKQIDGVWHSGLVVDGIEYFFGQGIHKAPAGTTMFGRPYRTLLIGHTQVPHAMLHELLADMAPRYRPQDYSLLFHNCNTFSNELALLLTGEGIPEYILAQAQEVLSTPMGQMLMPMLLQMEGALGSAGAQAWDAPEPGMAPAAGASAGVAAPAAGAGASISSTTSIISTSSPSAAAGGDVQQVVASNVTSTSSEGPAGANEATTTATTIAAAHTQTGDWADGQAVVATSSSRAGGTTAADGGSGGNKGDAGISLTAEAASATAGIKGLQLDEGQERTAQQ